MPSSATQRVHEPSPPESGGRKPKGRGYERREEILDAAVRLFVEHGFANVSTRRIADALGISQTTLYVYFPTKDAILEAMCDQCFARLVASFQLVLAEAGTSLEQLRRLMRAYVQFGLEHSDQYRIAFMTEQVHMRDKSEFLNALPHEQPPGIQCFHLLQDHIARLSDENQLRFDPALVAQCLWSAGHGLVALLITMPSFPWAPREELIERMLDILLEGVLGNRR
jgi:AcrR family transcriptional regulator